MTNDRKKVPFTFRINKDLNKRIEYQATKLGVSKNSFITMTLDKSIRQENKGET